MTDEQIKAAKSLKYALTKVWKAELNLRVFDGSVYVVPRDVELWPRGCEDGNTFAILEEFGFEVGHPNLDADGGAGV